MRIFAIRQISRAIAAVATLAVIHPETASAQLRSLTPRPTAVSRPSARDADPTARRSGPRFGVLWVSDGIVQDAKARNVIIKPVLSLFGWQSEIRLAENPNGPQPVSDIVVLVAGLDQGLFVPSASWVVGVRTTDNIEMGVGPNVTAAGLALVITAGFTQRFGTLNVPVNGAFVPSKVGSRFSITTGFNTNR